jgi:hypothetical protein
MDQWFTLGTISQEKIKIGLSFGLGWKAGDD